MLAVALMPEKLFHVEHSACLLRLFSLREAMPSALPLPANVLSLARDLSIPALPDVEIQRLARLTDSSPEDFAKAMAALMRRLAIEGFRTIQAPRNYKEMATVIDLWRKLEGLDKDKGGALPVGLVGVLRSVNRRAVVDAEPVEECAFE